MAFVKKLIITISVVFLVTVNNIDADSITLQECEATLMGAKYTASNDGLQYYIERIFNAHFDANHSKEEFQQNIVVHDYENCLIEHWAESGEHKDNLETYYKCYLMVYIRDLPAQIDLAENWCAENYSDTTTDSADDAVLATEPSQTTSIQTCIDNLREDGFTFSLGIDNYAFALRVKNNGEDTGFKLWTKKYVKYLEAEGQKNFGVLDNTKNWSKNYLSEIILQDHGFNNRYRSFPNYNETVVREFESNCNSLDGNSKDYCNYLIQAYENSDTSPTRNIKKLTEDGGTYLWCKHMGTKILQDLIQDPENTLCEARLIEVGFKLKNDGLTNYVEKVFKKYFEVDHSVESFTSSINHNVEKCNEERSITLEGLRNLLEHYYECYLLVNYRDSATNVMAFEKWCEKKCSMDVPDNYTDSDLTACISKCKAELTTDKFTFPHGIDSYAYSLLIEDNEQTETALNEDTRYYMAYLKEEASRHNGNVDGTITWCKVFVCEDDLTRAGFKDRYDGSSNYQKTVVEQYGNDCNSLSGKAKLYCLELKSQLSEEGGSSSKKKKVPGTNDWCKNYITNN